MPNDTLPTKGRVTWVLTDDATGEVKASGETTNLVTQLGNQMYAERAVGVSGAPAAPTGMQLGTGTTAPATTGAGAAIVTVVANSLVALSPTVPTSSAGAGTSRRLTYTCQWPAGTATNAALAEAALVNQPVATQTAAPAANTAARVLLSPTINKGVNDTLTLTWTNDIGS